MSYDVTEAEQLESLKRWILRYRKPLTWLILSVVLVVSIGQMVMYQFDQYQQQASTLYDQLMRSVSAQDHPKTQAYATTLSQSYARTVYGDVAHLVLAREFVLESNMSKASDELRFVMHQGHRDTLRALARLRLCRILMYQKKYEEVAELLNVKSPFYQAQQAQLELELKHVRHQ